uniref:VWFA domain-containing protein n=1 Tax=Acrobeloides nanus TaxID=290746 RepID=A0A914CUV0_9BILA
MVKFCLITMLVLSCLEAEILACGDRTDGSSSDSSSSREHGCRRHKHHRHHKHGCDSGSSEEKTTHGTNTTSTTQIPTTSTTILAPTTTTESTTTTSQITTTTSPTTTPTRAPTSTSTTTRSSTITTTILTASSTFTTTTQAPTTTRSSTITTTTAPTTTTAFNCQKSSIDLVFVVDSSASIGIVDFNKALNALASTVKNISVGPNDNQSHIGMVTFDSTAIKQFGLSQYMDNPSVENAIIQVPYTAGSTDIASGMNMAIDQVFGQAGNRPNSPDIMIVITDGQDTSDVAGAQIMAYIKNIIVFAVGVGDYVDYSELVAVAGSTDRAYNATNFDFLDKILQNICGNLAKRSADSGVETQNDQQSACNYEEVKEILTKQEFCRAKPYCSLVC